MGPLSLRGFYYIFITVVFLSDFATTQECDESTLRTLLDALSGSVQYTAQHKNDMNLDGIVSLTMFSDRLKVLESRMDMDNIPPDLKSQLYEIRDKATDTYNAYWYILKDSNPLKFHVLGRAISPGSWELHYPLRALNRSLIEKPKTCEEINWSWRKSDYCFSELLNYKSGGKVSEDCWKYMTSLGFKDYPLTHELIYIIFGETNGYFKTFNDTEKENVEFLQNYICANVIRDAEELSNIGLPASTRDLFLEQIGLCSLYSFTDFLRRDWIEMTLSWREPNGCYLSPIVFTCLDDKTELLKKRRYKRDNVTLKDGCSSHTTSMGVLAMSMQINFCLEMMYGNGVK